MPATDTFLRNLKTMHVVFAASAVGLFVATIWMTWADYADEWRDYQRVGFQIQAEKLRADLGARRSELEQTDLPEKQKSLAEAEAAFRQQEPQRRELEERIARLRYEVSLADRGVRFQRAERDAARANYDLAVRDNRTREAARRLRIFQAEQKKVDDLEKELQEKEAELAQAESELSEATRTLDEIRAEVNAAHAEVDRIQAVLDQIAPDSLLQRGKRKMMEWVIVDGFNSHLKPEQLWLPDLKIGLGMAQTARFDRCVTCHTAIDLIEEGGIPAYPHGTPESDDPAGWVAEGKFPHPYSTHPNPELYLTATSPHPKETFGCTICHDGQGSATSFTHAAHSPNDPHQEQQWKKDYGFYVNHYWELPMLPQRLQEASCLKCHHSVVELGVNEKFGASAPKLYEGYELIKKYGCFGCHEINGFDGAKPIGPDLRLEPSTPQELAAIEADPNQTPGRERKVGPSLRHLASKTTPGWVDYWTEEPKRFRPSTKMPQFFKLSNQVELERLHGGSVDMDHLDLGDDSDATSRRFAPVEITAVTQYLFSKSQPLDLLAPPEGYEPDPRRGRELFAQKGCLACHTHSEFPEIETDFAPSLDEVHKKVRPGADGFHWLYTWIRDPERYHPRTKMPNLFLEAYRETAPGTEPEDGLEPPPGRLVDPAADIAAFLLDNVPEDYEPLAIEAPYVGLETVSLTAADARRLRAAEPRGALITAIVDNGPATRARLVEAEGPGSLLPLQVDDVVLRFNGTDVRDGAHLDELVAGASVGRPVQLDVWRGDRELPVRVVVDEPLNDLVRLFLSRTITARQVEQTLESRRYPHRPESITGDEIELAAVSEGEAPGDDEWRQMKLNYVGRRTISQYGCYGCHDIPGFETARPIGTPLQDWGRKDTSQLALEHIEEYLHHHGERDGSATHERVNSALRRVRSGELRDPETKERELSAAHFYASLLHHERPGFLWQKLRDPRSYDYKKTETKGYDERLRMPQFPLEEREIEAIATFVLGLVAEPPAEKYVFRPQGAKAARIKGEELIAKYNCASCHMLELPTLAFGLEPGDPEDDPSGLRRFVGMTGDDLAAWFLEHHRGLAEGDLPEDAFPQDVEQMAALGADLQEIASVIRDTDRPEQQRESVKDWFARHPEYLLASPLDPNQGETLAGVRQLFRLKPPQAGETGETLEDGTAVVQFRGLLASPPDPDEDPDFQFYSYQLWDTLDVGGRILLPSANMSFAATQIPAGQTTADGTPTPVRRPGRGGEFGEWLVEHLVGRDQFDVAKRNRARQSAPPVLHLEGKKVQTPWLFRFLRNPEPIRHEAVLRMPRFNMSDEEAQALADYFAAVDNEPYPYQEIPQREPHYHARRNAEFRERFGGDDYLAESWGVLSNNRLCIGCHAVAGREFQAPDPTQVTHGPDLDDVADRLRPEWLHTWLYSPKWIAPYTGMPAPGSKPEPGYFGDEADAQTQGLRDALMNYHRLMEQQARGYVEPLEPIPLDDVSAAEGPGL